MNVLTDLSISQGPTRSLDVRCDVDDCAHGVQLVEGVSIRPKYMTDPSHVVWLVARRVEADAELYERVVIAFEHGHSGCLIDYLEGENKAIVLA
jgi:hypothetical protein